MTQEKNNPSAVLVTGPCRSGTTWVQTLLSDESTDSYFQPFKHAVRCRLFSQPPALAVRDDADRVVVKEALGPYFLDEIRYDPVACFNASLPRHDRRVILCMDDPANCFLSWVRSFRRVSEAHLWIMFVEAYRETRRLWMRLRAERCSVLPFTLTLYEGCVSAEAMTRVLLHFAGATAPGGLFFSIRKVRDPAFFEVAGLLDEAKKASALMLKRRSERLPREGFDELNEIYAEFIAAHRSAHPTE
jgi:hypothetical protein